MLLWATKLPVSRPWSVVPGQNEHRATNRAWLVLLAARNQHGLLSRLGWCALPSYLWNPGGPLCSRERSCTQFLNSKIKNSKLPLTKWNPIQLSTIIHSYPVTKSYPSAGKLCFFRQMIWEFWYNKQLEDVIDPHDPCTDHPISFASSLSYNLINVCLIAYDWDVFLPLFQYLVKNLLENPSPMPNIKCYGTPVLRPG